MASRVLLWHHIIGPGSKQIPRKLPMIMMHGIFGTRTNLETLARSELVSRDRDCYLLDLRNHGHSFHSEDMRLSSVVEDVVYFMDQMGMQKAIWLGHSYGGKVAYLAGLLYPEYVSSIIALDIIPETHAVHTRKRDYSKLLEILQRIPSMKFKSRTAVEQFVVREKPDMDIFEARFVLSTLFQTQSGKENDEWHLRMNVDGLLDQLENIGTFEVNDNQSGLEPVFESPTYVIRGGASDFVQDIDLPSFYRQFPNSTVMTVDGASHYLHIQKRPETQQCVVDALREIDRLVE